jgi:hypothetical protein
MQTELPRWRVIARLDDAGPLWRVHRAAASTAPAAPLTAPRRSPVTVPLLEQAPAPPEPPAHRASRLVRLRLPRRLSPEVWVALLATVLSVSFYVWYAHQGLTLAYADSISHMMIARRVLFSRTPGLAQLGTVWLPLTHMLMLPFIWWDALFYSGLAGSLPSMVAYVLGAVYLYRLANLAFESVSTGVIAALVFVLNPSTLYMQSTPMTELPLMALAIITIYYATRWARTFAAPDLVKCAAATFAATLVRYDAWALAGGLCVLLLLVAWRRGGWQLAEANILLYGTFALAGCVAWLIYQQVIVGNAFDFLTGPYSAERQQRSFFATTKLPTLHNPLLSLRVYSQATVDTVSWPILIVALIGLAIWLVRARARMHSLLLFALLVPFAFNWYSLVRGSSVLETPEIPFVGVHTYFNERYGMMMVPAVALFFAFAVTQVRLAALPSGGLIAVLAITGTLNATPYALQDPLVGANRVATAQLQEGAWLATHCAHGTTLISESGFEIALFYSHVPLSKFITNASDMQFQQAIAHPENMANCVAMDAKASTFEPVWEALHTRTDWQEHFKLAAQFGTASFYQRIDQQISGGTTPPVQAAVISQRSVVPGRPSNSITLAQGGGRG